MSEEDYKSVGEIKNQWIETKDEYLDMALNVIDNLKIKNQQLKEVIEQIREYIKNSYDMSVVNNYLFLDKPVIDKRAKKDLLEILDKVGDVDEKKN